MKNRLSLILLAAALLLPGCAADSVPESPMVKTIASAVYPEMPPYPDGTISENRQEAHDIWNEARKALRNHPEGYDDGLDSYCKTVIRTFLADTGNENRVFSPLSLYSALAMTAETAGGESREQILSLLGSENEEELRRNAKAVWESNYINDGASKSILANSLWLDRSLRYNEDTLNTLADYYYASSFSGEMGSEVYNEALQSWLNEQTGGLLADSAESEGMDKETVMALVSAVDFSAKWMYEFHEDETEAGVFHGADGDEEAKFMKFTELDDTYYWADDFAAYYTELENVGGVWFVLPDEDVSVDDVLSGEDFYRLLEPGTRGYRSTWENKVFIKINIAIPKFRIQSELYLREGLTNLGVTDVFSPEKADFSPLTIDFEDPVWLDQAKQSVTVEIDEEGITAAAYTKMTYYGAPPPPEEVVDFICDRPFLFAVIGNDGFPLFTGVVNSVK